MESKVSEGGLNVTLTIRLLMHGKVMWGRKRALPARDVLSTSYSLKSPTHRVVACTVQITLFLELLKAGWPNTCTSLP